MNAVTSSLYAGSVMHLRLRPRRHRLKYRLFQLLLDIDELDVLARRLKLFSRNRFNIFSFHDSDHGDRTGGDLRQHVEKKLADNGIDTLLRQDHASDHAEDARLRVQSAERLFLLSR